MKCSICGAYHGLEELELSFERPDAIAVLSEAERERRCKLFADLARLDNTRWFVRGTIPFSVEGRAQMHRIEAWTEVEKSSFDKTLKLWDDESQSRIRRSRRRSQTRCPGDAASLRAPVLLRLVGPDTRPGIFLADASSTLGAEQANGISQAQAMRYSRYVFHGDEGERFDWRNREWTLARLLLYRWGGDESNAEVARRTRRAERMRARAHRACRSARVYSGSEWYRFELSIEHELPTPGVSGTCRGNPHPRRTLRNTVNARERLLWPIVNVARGAER